MTESNLFLFLFPLIDSIVTNYGDYGVLKLVRTPLNVYFTAVKSSFLSLYAHINSDECHAWFHLNAASSAVRNAEQVNITKNSYPR